MAGDPTRRGFLASAGTLGAAATAGCLSQLRSRVAFTPMQQVSLSVGCVPADRDPSATAIARDLRDVLDAVGVDVSLSLTSEEQLLRDALYNHEFDLLVTRVPGHADPDEVRTLLHSRFAQEEGWQNPSGYANRPLDDLLERQRRPMGGDRRELLASIQQTVVEEAPLVPLVAPTDVHAFAEHLDVPEGPEIADRRRYLLAERDDEPAERLRVSLLHPEPTTNRNVLAAEVRARDRLVPCLYDRLVEPADGEYVPWLADQLGWTREENRLVELRPGLTWHDGEPLTADDVAFTYEFLQDTTLGGTESPVPAPRFRSQSSLVADATAIDDRTVRIDIDDVRRSLVDHALTVPVLPAHRWRERSELEREYLPRALLADVEEPVGSGPLAFESATPEEALVLRRFDDHFLRTADRLADPLESFRGGPTFEWLEASVTPNVTAAINGVTEGDVDIVDGPVPAQNAADVREADRVRTIERRSEDYYAVWFDSRSSPLSNYTFRTAIARCFDRDAIVETAFDGMAAPVESPLHGTEYVPQSVAWTGTSELGSFPGLDGELNVERARDLFRDAGFRYHEGELLARQPRAQG